jgi:hypothetical protein
VLVLLVAALPFLVLGWALHVASEVMSRGSLR